MNHVRILVLGRGVPGAGVDAHSKLFFALTPPLDFMQWLLCGSPDARDCAVRFEILRRLQQCSARRGEMNLSVLTARLIAEAEASYPRSGPAFGTGTGLNGA